VAAVSAPTKIPETEAGFMGAIIELAHHRGWLVAHFRPARVKGQTANDDRWVTPMQGDAGFPDLVLARRGRVIFAELKKEGGKVSPAQKAWAEELSGATEILQQRYPTHEAFIWYPSDRPLIEKMLA